MIIYNIEYLNQSDIRVQLKDFTQPQDASDSSQHDHITPSHFVSPNINSRINQLLQNSRSATTIISQPPQYSPPLLRSRTQ